MRRILRFLGAFLVIPFVAGCAGMMPVYDLKDQPVGGGITQDAVKAAIKSGASTAGWGTQDAGSGKIVATYQIRVHTVVADINYSANGYSIIYRRSDQMKVICTQADKDTNRVTVTGQSDCPGGARPEYIHGNYRVWFDDLNAAIVAALGSA